MKILSINTANKQADLAVLNNDVLHTKKMSASEKHSESAMIGIDELLNKANLQIKNLDAVATIVGPGSFTGIRIGISLALGFKTVFEDLKLISIDTFEFLKAQFLEEFTPNSNFLCVFNALSEKYFIQEFDKNGNAIFNAKMVDGQNFVKEYPIIVGLKEENMDFLTYKVDFEPEVLNKIAVNKFKNAEFQNTLTPLYLRKSQAEDMLDKKGTKIWKKILEIKKC